MSLQVEIRYPSLIPVYLLSVDVLLDDFLVAENSPFQSDINSPVLTSERASTITSPRINNSHANRYETVSNDGPESPLSCGIRL